MAEGRPTPFGEQLRRLREAAGITQEELAERTGLSRDAVSALERGLRRHPHPQTLRALSDGLGLSERELAALRAAVPRRQSGPATPPAAAEGRLAPPPVPLTRLVGRQRELADLQRLLTTDGARLVTLTGPAGVGKTRLAIEAANEMAPAFADGVAFVRLAPINDPALVLPTIAEAVGVRDTSERSVAERTIHALRDRRLLLVLDNFEHLVGAAAPVAELLAACPALAALATSRATLRLSGEHEYPVAPLPLPGSPERAAHGRRPRDAASHDGDAVTLFVQRARAARPEFALTSANAPTVAEICRRLDGLPLAIELAAARIKVLSPEALLGRLGSSLGVLSGGPQDQPPRLRSMHDAVAWSYGLLDPAEQTFFRRLAVFTGGFTLDAAEQVTGAGSPVPTSETTLSVLDGIASLVDKSLVRRLDGEGDEPRFGMLTTVQHYGLEQLASGCHPGEESAVRQAHAACFVDLAELAWPAFRHRIGQASSLRRLEAERGNLRAALAWLDEQGDVASLLQLSGALFWFWYVRGPLSEGRFWLERALAGNAGGVPTDVRVRAMVGAAMLAHFQGDDAPAERWLGISLATCATLGDPWWRAISLLLLGIIAEDRGDYAAAVPKFDAALALFRAVPDRVHTALALNHLGIAAWGLGEIDRATALCAEAVDLQRATGDQWGLANCLAYLGLLAGERGEYERAALAHHECLELRWATRAWEGIAGSLANVAAVAAAVDRPEPAARLFGAAMALLEELGRVLKLPERAVYERTQRRAEAALGARAFAAARAEGRVLPREQAVGEALALAAEIAGLSAGQASDAPGSERRSTRHV